MAEGFLFAVGAGLVLGETYRSSRKNEKRRDQVAERLEDLEAAVEKLSTYESQDVKHLQERCVPERARRREALDACSKVGGSIY